MLCACVCRLLYYSLVFWTFVFLFLAILFVSNKPPEPDPEVVDLVQELVDQYFRDGPLPYSEDDDYSKKRFPSPLEILDSLREIHDKLVQVFPYTPTLDPSDVPEAPLPAAVTQGLAQPRAPFVV